MSSIPSCSTSRYPRSRTAGAEEIYKKRLPLAIALERIERLYKPFHGALASLIDSTARRFGAAMLIDCHSMPSSSTGYVGPQRPDFVLGDRFGASCDGRMTRFLREELTALGYTVHLNRPYAGGYITEYYGRPQRGLHALQIEINRALYLNERTFEKKPSFAVVERNLRSVVSRLFTELPGLPGGREGAEQSPRPPAPHFLADSNSDAGLLDRGHAPILQTVLRAG